MILLIDNFDSFVHNLARHFRRLGQETVTVRNNAIDPSTIQTMSPDAVVISPGPGAPRDAGCSVEVVKQLSGELPILGVCLGHQAIVEAVGGRIVRSAPMHGRISQVEHDGQTIFAGLPSPMTVCRYHSLTVERSRLPTALKVTAQTTAGEIMAIEHRQLPLYGVQFHPEAILTEFGYELLANFLRIVGCKVSPISDVLLRTDVPIPPIVAPPQIGGITF